MFSLICVWINDWGNNRKVGDLRRYRGHYDVTEMHKMVRKRHGHSCSSTGLYSLNGGVLPRDLAKSRSSGIHLRVVPLLWNWTDGSAEMLPMRLTNSRAIRPSSKNIFLFWNLAKISCHCRLVDRDPRLIFWLFDIKGEKMNSILNAVRSPWQIIIHLAWFAVTINICHRQYKY